LLAAGGVGNTKLPKETKKPFRETINPLKNLKIAKSAVFEAQGYQGVSKTHDFVGETISFGFRFTWLRLVSREIREGSGERVGGRLKNLENAILSKKAFLPHNPLKLLKTPKGIFGKT